MRFEKISLIFLENCPDTQLLFYYKENFEIYILKVIAVLFNCFELLKNTVLQNNHKDGNTRDT